MVLCDIYGPEFGDPNLLAMGWTSHFQPVDIRRRGNIQRLGHRLLRGLPENKARSIRLGANITTTTAAGPSTG
jgi:hypothetical protein